MAPLAAGIRGMGLYNSDIFQFYTEIGLLFFGSTTQSLLKIKSICGNPSVTGIVSLTLKPYCEVRAKESKHLVFSFTFISTGTFDVALVPRKGT